MLNFDDGKDIELDPVTPAILCRECNSPMWERENHATGNKFYGCSEYPNCTFTLPIDFELKDGCPECGVGVLIERVNKNSGETFYGCSQFPECDYIDRI